MIYIFAFIIVFISQCLGMLLVSWLSITFGFGQSGFYFLVASFIYLACGFLLNFINIKILHIRMWLFFLLILVSSTVIVLTFLQTIGTIDIPFDILDDIIQEFWMFVFMASEDPLSILVMGFINIPLLLICTPLSYAIIKPIFSHFTK
jgi:hypothetical protein